MPLLAQDSTGSRPQRPPVPPIQAAVTDSFFRRSLSGAAASAFGTVQQTLADATGRLAKNDLSSVASLAPDPGVLKKLKKTGFDEAYLQSEVNGWQTAGISQYYVQHNLAGTFLAAGIPVSGRMFLTEQYAGPQAYRQLNFSAGYQREAFQKMLQVDKDGLQQQAAAALSFEQQVNLPQVLQNSFTAVPGFPDLLAKTGCSWESFLQLPAEQLRARFNPQQLSGRIADAQQLRDYYQQALDRRSDSSGFLLRRRQQADSLLQQYRQAAQLYERLYEAKAAADAVQQKAAGIKALYEEKVKKALSGYNAVQSAIQGSPDLSRLQKLALKVKGLHLGQHSLSTGELVLRGYPQNGVSLEVEDERLYFLLTYGTQEGLAYNNLFYGNNSTGNITEHYQVGGRYRLAGASIGRGKKGRSFQQVSALHFQRLPATDSALQKTVTVFTVNSEHGSPGRLLSYGLSKSITRFSALRPGTTVPATGNEANLFSAMGLLVNYAAEVPLRKERHRLRLQYNALEYENPGLNGAGARPGLQLSHDVTKQLSTALQLKNSLQYYHLDYGDEGARYTNFWDRLESSYKLGRYRLGLLLNWSQTTQEETGIKTKQEGRALDLLATVQGYQRFGGLVITAYAGAGFGQSREDGQPPAQHLSYFFNGQADYRQLSFSFNVDRFQTRSSEVYLVDSGALFLSSAFNLEATAGYRTEKMNLFQAGIQYKEFNGNRQQLFVTALCDWTLWKNAKLGGRLSLPVTGLQQPLPINAFLTAQFTYKLF